MTTRITLTALLAASVLLGLGCTTTEINPGTDTSAVYRFGALNATVNAPIDATYKASEQAATSLSLSVVQRLEDKLNSRITARDSQDKKVEIEMLSVAPDKTKLTIKVDSQAKAARIYQTILDQLGTKK
jgi:microcompartment protein CcmL/EutN